MTMLQWLFGQPVTDEQIITAIDPWTLACAVGAENGSIGVRMGFKHWLGRSRDNWMPAVKKKCPGASQRRIENVLRQFVRTHCDKSYGLVMQEQETIRGQEHGLVIGPGESVTMTVAPR